MSRVSLFQVDDVLWRTEVWEENHVRSDGGRSPRPPLVSLTSDPWSPASDIIPLLCNFCLLPDSPFYYLNILVAGVSSLNTWHLFYNSKGTNNVGQSSTCIQPLRQKPFTVKWNVIYLSSAASQMSSLFLFSYPCYHIRYSFVPCKYIHVVVTPPSSCHPHPRLLL